MDKALAALKEFLKLEAFSGILLAACTAIAMVLANHPTTQEFYFQLLQTKIALSIHHWINDGLMVIFFFVVGLEIKKELLIGELSSRKKASLPIAAAIGGMIFPALIYIFLNPEYPNSKGWGIPMATDIAFAIAVLSFFRVPLAMKVFLLALAIVDDLGAVLVIALFYTQKIQIPFLLMGFLSLALIEWLKRKKIESYSVYLILGGISWLGILLSGVHATIAGVLLGLITPIEFRGKTKTIYPLSELIHKLHPWVTYCIMPIFALANAGVQLSGANTDILENSIHRGVLLGLLLGKPLGIFLFSFLAVKLKFAELPNNTNWGQILSVGALGGVGFTMALFISELALYPEQDIYSKTAILLASVLSTCMGSVLLTIFSNKKAI